MLKFNHEGVNIKLGKASLAALRKLHVRQTRRRTYKLKKESLKALPELDQKGGEQQSTFIKESKILQDQKVDEQPNTCVKESKFLQTAQSSSQLTFDLEEIVADANGTKVTNTRRPYRASVSILATKNLKRQMTGPNAKRPIFKVRVDQGSQTSKEVRNFKEDIDGVVAVNQTFTFEVRDLKTATLSVYAYNKALWGMNEPLGSCIGLNISAFTEENGAGEAGGTKWCDLRSKEKKPMPGKVLLHVVGGIAEPEQKITTFVGTWNIANTRPPSDLSSWIPTNNIYDIVAIGTQECDYKPQKAFSDCGKEWLQTLNTNLGPRYKLIHSISRGQMRLGVFVRDDMKRAISAIDSGSEATGAGNIMANKGGVAISFKFWDTSLCFVNCHFAAHEGNVRIRNSNYREIAGKLRIGYRKMDIMNQFHYVFWSGDLNYRLDFGANGERKMTWQGAVRSIESGNYTNLLSFDELQRETGASRVLYGFKEGSINFPPTFKVIRGTLTSYSQKRMPAWCDRILWRTLPGYSAKLDSYVSSPTVLSSDHNPVAATFTLTAHALPFSSFSSMDQEDRRWHIRFMYLRAKNLEASNVDGFSDPYLCFEGENVLGETFSKVKFRTLNPVWNPQKELRPLVLKTFPLQRIEKEYLFVRILNNYHTSADDILGYTVIPLTQAVIVFRRGSKGIAHFKVGLSHRGLPSGTLEGGMRLTWEKNFMTRRAFMTNNFMIRKKGIKELTRILTSKSIPGHFEGS